MKLGLAEPSADHAGSAPASIRSATVLPKVGEPLIRSLSLVCRGPLISSSPANRIRLQYSPFVPGIGEL